MKTWILGVMMSAGLLSACQTNETTAIGGQTDKYGCIIGTGATWSVLKQQCVQTFNVADIRLEETKDGTTYGIYVILSGDKQQAEVFSISLPENTILQRVQDGYASSNGKIRLVQKMVNGS